MKDDFELWLRENSIARECEHYLSGQCGIEEKAIELLSDYITVKSFRCGGDLPADNCELWEAESDYRQGMYANHQANMIEQAEAQRESQERDSIRGWGR
jgi:hypothetical protein